MMRLLPVLLIFAALPGCSTTTKSDLAGAPQRESVFARLLASKDGQLVPIGQAQIVDRSGSLKLFVDIEKDYLPATGGPYGMHIHAVGRCDLPDFASAGPHWNPAGKQHGHDNPAGAHAGDLPNINLRIGVANSTSADIADVTLAEFMDADGASIIIHEKADDYKTDPSGNSGKRIVCGVFEKP
jgi:superoxide dismutase, Cu-Zn family